MFYTCAAPGAIFAKGEERFAVQDGDNGVEGVGNCSISD